MITVLTIAGVDYAGTDRIEARIHFDGLERNLAGPDGLEFSVQGGSCVPDWPRGTAVSATIDFEDGGGPLLKFKGEITDIGSRPGGPLGWTTGYTCQGLRYQTDRVSVTAPDLSGNYVLNRRPDDPYGVDADRGLTLGQMFTRVLAIQQTADALAAIGVQYSSLSPPTLHADTVADFALLTVVPPQPENFGGEAIFTTLDQKLSRWMPKYVLEVPPGGIIRCKDTTSTSVFVPRTLTLPGPTGSGDPGVDLPAIRSSTARCATRVVLRGGPLTKVTLLSTANGTLEEAWTSGDESAWTLYDFTSPKDARSVGDVASVTGNTATVHPDDGTATWGSNFWSGRQANIYLYDTTIAGFTAYEFRRVTANAAHSAGVNSTISWDSSQPLPGTGYDRYEIIGGAGSKNDVGRLYNVRDPVTGDLGLDTDIGSHLVIRAPKPQKFANNSLSIDVFYAQAIVRAGTVPIEVPWGVEALPATGQFRLTRPAVLATGAPGDLNQGYPATVARGLPIDVRVYALYSTGALEAVVPPDVSGLPQYEGTAYTVDGFEQTQYIDIPAYADEWDVTSMTLLAQEHLDSVKDIVWEGSGDLRVEPDFDVLEFNYALNYAIDGAACPWGAINAPVRSVKITWPQGSGSRHLVTFGFSTQRRAFSGDDLYLHPAFGGGSALDGLYGGIGLEAFAGQSVAGSFQMPVGQDQGDFSFEPGGRQRGGMDARTPAEKLEQAQQRNRSDREEARQRGHFNSPEAQVERTRARVAAREAAKDRREDARDDAHQGRVEQLRASLDDPGREHTGLVRGESAGEQRDREARQPARMTRDEALAGDTRRREAINAQEPYHPPSPEILPSRDEALAADQQRRQASDAANPAAKPQPRAPQMTRDQAVAQDQERRTKINQDWADRHRDDTQNAGGGE